LDVSQTANKERATAIDLDRRDFGQKSCHDFFLDTDPEPQSPSSNTITDIEDQLHKFYYVPVAFVIQTKVEFHDAFKLILKALFESLKIDIMAYAEMIAHLAFLRTIPAPVFNSEINLLFMDTFINIKENSFNELPHKN
jgi:hypothetical protein